jgi:hypothetical protein
MARSPLPRYGLVLSVKMLGVSRLTALKKQNSAPRLTNLG